MQCQCDVKYLLGMLHHQSRVKVCTGDSKNHLILTNPFVSDIQWYYIFHVSHRATGVNDFSFAITATSRPDSKSTSGLVGGGGGMALPASS